MNRIRSIGWSFAASALISGCSGCSSEAEDKKQPRESGNNPFSAYAIHVFGEQKPGVEVELAFPPVEAVSNPSVLGSAVAGPGSKPTALLETDGGMVDTDEEVEPGWLLLMRAAHDCADPPGLRGFVSGITAPWAPDTGHDAWYVFADKLDDPGAFARFESCEENLAMQHILLCTADKLQEIADTISPVVWPGNSGGVSYVWPNGVTPPDYINWKWTIPPQSSKDKFIIRDLALNVLANLARLDLEPPYATGAAPNQPLPVGKSCADAWVASADQNHVPDYFANSSTTIYSTAPIAPEPTIVAANRVELAELRLRQNTQILRTAGRMTRTLIKDSVMADMAGAEQQRGRAADTQRGASLFWGAETDSTAPYNSLTHAFRTVFGRWESNRLPTSEWAAAPTSATEARVPSGDPACGGLAPMELLSGSGEGISARWADKRTKTPEQEFATRMLDRAGIIFPKDALDDISGVKTAVKDQLVLNAATGAGFSSVTDPKFANRMLSIETMIDEIDDADFRFGMDRNLGAYRLLTGGDGATVPATDPAGVKLLASGIHASVSGIGGTVLHNGMVRTDIIGDMFARTAPGFTASQCSEVQPAGVLDGSANAGKTAAFQDSFMIGETYRRRLSQVRQLTAPSSFPKTSAAGDSAFPDLADRASAELRSWTGPGLAMFRFSSTRTLEVRILGMTPADLGVTTEAQMKTKIRAVWGKPWVADCATKARKSCPTDFDTDYIRPASVELVGEYEVPGYFFYTGADGRVLSLEFTLDQGPAEFAPTATAPGTPPDKLLYLIAAGDPEHPLLGKVLTSLAFRVVSPDWSYAPISNYQKKLAHDLFGVVDDWVSNGGKLGTPPTTSPPSYCITGIPRDFFVPLENELTSDSDSFESSWRHYLESAKESAAITDQLGQDLIEIGLQIDMKKEAAQKELGKICGDYTAGQQVVVDKGEVKATTDDASLNSCLNEEAYDVVFLTSVPPSAHMDDADIRTKYLGCESEDLRSICDSAYALDKAGLNIAPWDDPDNKDPPVVQSSCGATLALSDSLTANAGFAGNKVQSAMNLDAIDEDAMGALVGAVQVEMGEDLHWTAKLDGVLVMSTKSADTGLWPVCNTDCDNLPAPPEVPNAGQLQAEKLRRIFGSFDTANDFGKRNEAFERVAGALWLMAAVSGKLPNGLFTLPIPARNNFTSGSEPAPIVYTKGKFDETPPSSGNYYINLTLDSDGPLSGDDKDIIGVAHPIATDFANAVAGSQVRPDWVKGVYEAAAASGTDFLHIMASNEARLFPKQQEGDAVPWLIQQGLLLSSVKETGGSCTAPTFGVIAAQAALRKRKYPYDSVPIMCTAPSGRSLLLLRDGDSEGEQVGGIVSDVAYYHPDGDQTVASTIPLRQSGQKIFQLYNHEVYAGAYGACFHARNGTHQVPWVAASCLKDEDDLPAGSVHHTRFTRSLLSGTGCPPSGRAQAFTDWSSQYPNGCRAAREFAASIALTCVLGRAYRSLGIGDPLPALAEPGDIGKLTNWLDDQKKNVRVSLSRLHLVNVPKRILDEKEAGQVGSSAYKGDHGVLVLQYRTHLNTFATRWLEMEGSFDTIKGAIAAAQASLVMEKIINEETLAGYAMEEIQLHATIAKGFIAMAAGVAQMANPKATIAGGIEGAQSVANGLVDVASARQQLGVLQKLKSLAGNKKAIATVQILVALKAQADEAYTALQTGIEAMQTAVAEAHQTASQLAQKENDAKYEAAQAAGAGYYLDSDGNAVVLPVNTVQRRMYDITKRRYEASLESSKYLAYMARLAIEQRVGMRLEEMDEPVGALEAPSLWANDVCSFQGVNYDSLRKTDLPDGGIFSAINEIYYLKFADPFIGDYVQKLDDFVEFYNINYPAHEGDDAAVLSIRDDLLGPGGQCYRPSRNLLLHSHDLTQIGSGSEDGTQPPQGWLRNPCDVEDAYCLVVAPGKILKQDSSTPPVPLPPPGVAPSEGFTWLHETDDVVGVSGTEPAPPVTPSPPTRAVYQAVELGLTPYALSWHDMARGELPDETPTSATEEYTVGVYGPNWDLIESFTGLPHVFSTSEPWKDRALAFTPKTAGTHYVAFSASVKGAITPGSVAIANVQLEEAPSVNAITGYEATSASRLILSGDCIAGSPAQFRNAFEYICDDINCFYQLQKQFAVNIPALLAGSSALQGKIAQGNFNYRHLTTALNVVGTGVVDCTKSPTPSCFGSPYLEYTFEHDVYDAHMIDYLGAGRPFDFGSAGIFFGKGLAAERFVTLPMGSADQAFFSQPEFKKVEFSGRPLDGQYRLRVYDNPALNWTQVEDIQFIVNYRYWSRVTRSDPRG